MRTLYLPWIDTAREGAKHLDFLLSNKLTKSRPSDLMRLAYELADLESSVRRLEKQLLRIRENKAELPNDGPEIGDMILEKKSGKVIAEALEVPALEEEIERAIWQVKRALRSQGENSRGKGELVSGTRLER